jgi:mono/diheme cytochrome c family protein
MRREVVIIGCALMAVGGAGLAGSGAIAPVALEARQGQAQSGWELPPDAEDKKSPLQVDAAVLATGRAVFKDKCVKCHGPAGLGDGPDADPEHRDHMNLTNPKYADRNADGIVFYKVWNGRRRPKMPPFKDEITEQQAWSVVAYVQTLRKK